MKTFTLLFMLLVLVSLAVGEVVQSFQQSCPQFFIPNPQNQNKRFIPTIPQGAQYKQICQRWKNKYQYATLFDTYRRIPLYSAYTYYTPENEVERNDEEDWKNEPQLYNKKGGKEMRLIEPNEMEKIFSQALERDYRNRNRPPVTVVHHSRGHVFPNSYGVNQDQADSSFTMTNVAPQTEPSNREWAEKVEEPMLKDIKEKCELSQEKPAYIVTGVVPGQRWIPIVRGNKEYERGVNIPTHYWTAFSCTKKFTKVSAAYLAEQKQPSPGSRFRLKKMTLDELNSELTKVYQTEQKLNNKFNVFPPQRRNSI